MAANEHGTVIVNDARYSMPMPASLAEIINQCSPFGSEPVLATVGGTTYRSIDCLDGIMVQNGQSVDMFPLIIGG